jgi:hypothetical protein
MPKQHYQSTLSFLHKSGVRARPEAPSLIGKRFKLKERTLAIEVLDSGRRAITIPAGAIISVVHGAGLPSPIIFDRTLDILWEDRRFEIFTCDVNMRGMVISD